MKCSEAIKNNLCLGCNKLEVETSKRQADCGYIVNRYEVAKKIIKGVQQKL